MRIAFSSKPFQRQSISDSIDAIAFAGYEGIEIWCNPPHAYPAHMTFHEVARVKRRLDQAGIAACCLDATSLEALGEGWGPSWCSPERLSREVRLMYTLGCIRFASMLETPYVSIGCGGPGGLLPHWEAMSVFEEGLYVALEHAAESGVKLLVEPMPGGLLECSEDLIHLVERLDSEALGVCLDVGSVICVEEEPDDVIRMFEEKIYHARIGDVAASKVPHSFLPGDGAVDYACLAEAFEEIGYKEFLCLSLDPSKRFTPDMASLALERMTNLSGRSFMFD